jgi:ABC transporter
MTTRPGIGRSRRTAPALCSDEGLDTPTSGRVVIGDADLTSMDDDQRTRLRRDRIGFVFQAYNLIPTLNALENITLPMDVAGREPDRELLAAVIDVVGLKDRLRHMPVEFSGGQQQRGAVVYTLHRRLGPITQPALHALKSWSKHAFARHQRPSTLGYAKPFSKEKPNEGLKLVETRVQQLRLLHPLVHDVGSETSKTANGQLQLIQRQPGLGECILNTTHMGPGVPLARRWSKGLHRYP